MSRIKDICRELSFKDMDRCTNENKLSECAKMLREEYCFPDDFIRDMEELIKKPERGPLPVDVGLSIGKLNDVTQAFGKNTSYDVLSKICEFIAEKKDTKNKGDKGAMMGIAKIIYPDVNTMLLSDIINIADVVIKEKKISSSYLLNVEDIYPFVVKYKNNSTQRDSSMAHSEAVDRESEERNAFREKYGICDNVPPAVASRLIYLSLLVKSVCGDESAVSELRTTLEDCMVSYKLNIDKGTFEYYGISTKK